MTVELSALDEARFGIRTARAKAETAEELETALTFCRTESVRLLIARLPIAQLALAQRLEQVGAHLCDTLVYYQRLLITVPDADAEVTIRPVQPSEAAAVGELARLTFANYQGHYHADPRLDRAACDETYVDWAVRSCQATGPDSEVLIAEVEGQLAGFGTLRLNTPRQGEGVLFGVRPGYQGRGLYPALLIRGMHWAQNRGAKRMIVSTQATNLAVQTHWIRLGFEVMGGFYTFHLWRESWAPLWTP